ncbi:MAG TPA: hypothetical protein PKA58_18525 [Polyangium sp.]|nr:hypothetical protein [Polyangium sp.]
MAPKANHCPRCNAPLTERSGAWAVHCDSCQTDVSLLAPAGSSGVKPARQWLPSPGEVLRWKALFPVCTGLFGVAVPPTIYFLDRNDMAARSLAIFIGASLVAAIVYATGRRVLASFAAIPIGLVLLIKPFVRPVMHDADTVAILSDAHQHFLLPGIVMVAVFGILAWAAFDPDHKPPVDSKALQIAATITFIAGLLGGYQLFGGQTIRDVVEQHQAEGYAMRKKFFEFAKSLPAVGQVPALQEKLSPTPIWVEARPLDNNIDIITVEELWNPDDIPKGRDFNLSWGMSQAVRWTGVKSSTSSIAMGEQAGDFEKRLMHALQLPWLAAYRLGNSGMEVFVYDLRAGKVVTQIVVTGTIGNLAADRKLLVDTLAKATGGSFELK